jgi:hypothetical protein
MTLSITLRKCDTQHNDSQHNDTYCLVCVSLWLLSFMLSVTIRSIILSVCSVSLFINLGVFYAESHYAEFLSDFYDEYHSWVQHAGFHYAEYHYAEGHYAECLLCWVSQLSWFMLNVTMYILLNVIILNVVMLNAIWTLVTIGLIVGIYVIYYIYVCVCACVCA